eukprot:Nk52_evm6s276 gene=Nk52_evmTU6s276
MAEPEASSGGGGGGSPAEQEQVVEKSDEENVQKVENGGKEEEHGEGRDREEGESEQKEREEGGEGNRVEQGDGEGGVVMIPGTVSGEGEQGKDVSEVEDHMEGVSERQRSRLNGTIDTLIMASCIIQRNWRSYFNRKIFLSLKLLICRAEKTMTFEVLRRMIPDEANLLNDPTITSRVRFRFGGTSFPPVVLFKVFASSKGCVYLNGRDLITPNSKAAEDALFAQGPRKYLEKVLQDSYHNKSKPTRKEDVTNVKEYMQYRSNIDHEPASVGGRHNHWRELSMDVVPRQAVIDVFEHLKEYGRASVTSVNPAPYGSPIKSTASSSKKATPIYKPYIAMSPCPIEQEYKRVENVPSTFTGLERSSSTGYPYSAGYSSEQNTRIEMGPGKSNAFRLPSIENIRICRLQSNENSQTRRAKSGDMPITNGLYLIKELEQEYPNKALQGRGGYGRQQLEEQASNDIKEYSRSKMNVNSPNRNRPYKNFQPQSKGFTSKIKYLDVGSVIAADAETQARAKLRFGPRQSVASKNLDEQEETFVQRTYDNKPIPKPSDEIYEQMRRTLSQERLDIKSDATDANVKTVPINSKINTRQRRVSKRETLMRRSNAFISQPSMSRIPSATEEERECARREKIAEDIKHMFDGEEARVGNIDLENAESIEYLSAHKNEEIHEKFNTTVLKHDTNEEFVTDAVDAEQDIEDEATKLFEWSQNLSFDKYYQEWDDGNISSQPVPFGNRLQDIKSLDEDTPYVSKSIVKINENAQEQVITPNDTPDLIDPK